MTISALATILRKIAIPSLFFRSSDIARLLRCRFWKSGSWRAEKSGAAAIAAAFLARVDLDDIGAPIGKLAGAGRTGAHPRQIEDEQVLQRGGCWVKRHWLLRFSGAGFRRRRRILRSVG